jgi:hypothetical protein
MKKTVSSIFIALFAITFLFTSCSKDETTTAKDTEPTLSVSDSLGATTIDTNNFFVSPYLKISATPASGTTLLAGKFDVNVNGSAFLLGSFDSFDPDEVNGFSETIPVTLLLSGTGIPMTVGTKITLIFTVKDSKDKTASSSYTYTVIDDNGVLVSSEIELGAQNNENIPYKFLGVANNFATYTPGATGNARTNSEKIDFVYYYGDNDNNAFAAPINADGAKVVWASEINTWPRQNRTKFKTSTITAAEFDNIKNTSKKDDLFAVVDFSSGSTEKVTKITVGSVYSFQTASGVKGLAKFSAVSADKTGSTKVTIITQN